jgi:hypothetical protein
LLVAVTVIPLPAEFGAVNVAVVAVTGVTVPLDTSHVTPAPLGSLATVAVSVATWPTTNPPAFGVIVTVIPPAAAIAIVIVALADFVVSVTDVAVSVTVAGLGTLPGAVNVIGVPDALLGVDKFPHAAPVQPEPVSVQVTPLFAESPVTVAVKVVAAFKATVAVVCDSVTEIPAGVVIVMVADPDFVPSLTEVAAIVTVAGFGTVAGAVYVTAVPDALVVAESEPQPFGVAQESDHVTPLFALSFATVAVNICICPAATVAVAGVTVTLRDEPPVVVLALPPQPATNAMPDTRIDAATAHIRWQRR